MTNLPPPWPEETARDVPPPAGVEGVAPVARGTADHRPVVLSSGHPRDRRPGRGPDRRGAGADGRGDGWQGSRAGRRLALGASVLLVAASVAVAVWATRGGDDDATLGATPTDPADGTVATVGSVGPADGSTPSTDVSASTASTSSPSSPSSPSSTSTTTPVDPSLVEVGQAVRFTLPEGYSRRAVGSGVEITNGRLHYYAQVANRPPGEDPLVALQEYIAGFDTLYPSVAYTQVIPRGLDTSGVTPSDGSLVYYRVMAADGTGYKGIVDATRRADGLVMLTDLYTTLDDTTGETLPPSVPEQLYGSFLQTPAVGALADLAPLPVTRLTSTHPAYTLDGVVAVMPPVGWVADIVGPGRVALTHPLGQRFVAARLADTADPLVAQDLSAADLQTIWPGAAIGSFTASRETGEQLSYDAAFTATAADGSPVGGVVRIWIEPSTAKVFHAISSSPTTATAEPGHEAFLLAVLDISLTQPR